MSLKKPPVCRLSTTPARKRDKRKTTEENKKMCQYGRKKSLKQKKENKRDILRKRKRVRGVVLK